jgi:predicted tellurium resistance membrane protein TerC
MEVFLNADAWISFNFNVPEIVLGIDNIIFISIAQENYLKKAQKKQQRLGLPCLCVSYSIRNLLFDCYSWFSINFSWLECTLSGQSIILLLGGF